MIRMVYKSYQKYSSRSHGDAPSEVAAKNDDIPLVRHLVTHWLPYIWWFEIEIACSALHYINSKVYMWQMKSCDKSPWNHGVWRHLPALPSRFCERLYVVKDTGWRNLIPVRLSTERTPCYMLIEALRNKLI